MTAQQPQWNAAPSRSKSMNWPALLVIVGVVALAAIVFGRPGAAPSADKYLADYGGSGGAYVRILADTSCTSLQAEFDEAAANHDAAVPGSDEARWSTGYMAAANDRMHALGF